MIGRDGNGCIYRAIQGNRLLRLSPSMGDHPLVKSSGKNALTNCFFIAAIVKWSQGTAQKGDSKKQGNGT